MNFENCPSFKQIQHKFSIFFTTVFLFFFFSYSFLFYFGVRKVNTTMFKLLIFLTLVSTSSYNFLKLHTFLSFFICGIIANIHKIFIITGLHGYNLVTNVNVLIFNIKQNTMNGLEIRQCSNI